MNLTIKMLSEKINNKLAKYNSFFVPENLFLIFAIIFGLLFVFITPPFQVPDEDAHFFRAYEISDLNFIAQKKDGFIGDYLPASLLDPTLLQSKEKITLDEVIRHIDVPLNINKKTFIYFHGTAFYTPILYFPQAIGISLGKSLDLSPLILIYLGRIANLFVWILMIYAAIRIIPVAKWLFFFLALTPMSIFMAASLSADALTNGLSFLVISLALYYSLDVKKQKINRFDIFIILLISNVLSVSKQIYLFIPFLFLIIPSTKFKIKREYFLTMISLFMSIFLINAIWLFSNRHLIIPRLPGISFIDQFQFILGNNSEYMHILLNSIIIQGSSYIKSFIGILGWIDVVLPEHIYYLYTFILLFIALTDKNDIKIPLNYKIIFIALFSFGVFFLHTILYLYWNKVGSEIITGVQGRNFIPFAPLFFLLFYNCRRFINIKINMYLLSILLIYLLYVSIISIHSVYQKFYY